jgi:hypothetical protein
VVGFSVPSTPEEPWQYRVLDQLPSGIDEAQLREDLALTPTQRLEKLQALVAFAEEAARARRDRLR